MAVKTAFEPKDARINFDDRYYSDDFDEKREPRKRITGTQALVEFLNTTSPEEFQKNVPKRSSTLFFRRRAEKPTKNAILTKSSTTSTTSSPHTIHRKNYIEIIANPFTFSKNSKIDNNNPSPNNDTASIAKNNHVAIIGSQLNRTLSKSTSIYSLPHHNDKPVLPVRKGFNSSGTQTTAVNPTVTAGTATGFNRRQFPSLRIPTLVDHTTKNNQPAHSIFTATTLNNDADDMIEEGLKQRLQQYQINSLDTPSDAISKSLAKEHIAALGVVSTMIMDEQTHEEEERTKMKRKKKSRHIQVQTMPYYPNESNDVAVTVQTEPSTSIESNDTELKQRLKKMEHELKQEQLKNSRLQAALEETRDQFEVLSGLAYKKLREVWEEKTRWENACIEAKERCWHDHHKQIMGRHATTTSEDEDLSSCFVDNTIMDFMLDTEVEGASNQEEEEEDLI